MNKDNEKSHTITIRMNHELYEKLNKTSKKLKLNKSQLLRKSFIEWSELNRPIKEWITIRKSFLKDTMIIYKLVFKELLSLLDKEHVSSFGTLIAEDWVNKMRIYLLDMDKEEFQEDLFIELVKGFGSDGANWFDKFIIKKLENGNLRIFGTHTLNKNFSIFCQYFLNYIIHEEFRYEIIKNLSYISSTSFILEYQKIHKTA